MAPTNTGVRLTPLAALIDTATRTTMGKTIGTYLACARIPGPGWKSFDDIADDLTAMLAGTRKLNRVSVRTFAEDARIPDTRYVEGKSMPRPVSAEAVAAYVAALRERAYPGIDLDAVAITADEAVSQAILAKEYSAKIVADGGPTVALASALDNSAAGNVADLGDFTQYADDASADS